MSRFVKMLKFKHLITIIDKASEYNDVCVETGRYLTKKFKLLV